MAYGLLTEDEIKNTVCAAQQAAREMERNESVSPCFLDGFAAALRIVAVGLGVGMFFEPREGPHCSASECGGGAVIFLEKSGG